jgi:hypothetical protein
MSKLTKRIIVIGTSADSSALEEYFKNKEIMPSIVYYPKRGTYYVFESGEDLPSEILNKVPHSISDITNIVENTIRGAAYVVVQCERSKSSDKPVEF